MARVIRLFSQALYESVETLGIFSEIVDYQSGPFQICFMAMFDEIHSLRGNQMMLLEIWKQDEWVGVLE